jgi:hypothetical protein
MTGNEFVQRPWQFGATAKGQVFESVPGFSHKVRTIYKKVGPDGQEQRDPAFGSELDHLLRAFDSTSGGEVEIVEVDAVVNPQREVALEAQLVQWKERMANPRVGFSLQDGTKRESKVARQSSKSLGSCPDANKTSLAYSHLQAW